MSSRVESPPRVVVGTAPNTVNPVTSSQTNTSSAATTTVVAKKVNLNAPSAKIRPIRNTPINSEYQVLTEDFSKNAIFTFKYKANIEGRHVLATKAVFGLEEGQNDKKARWLTLTQDPAKSFARFTTGVDRTVLEGRIWRDGRFKIAADFGYVDKNNRYNLFGLFRSNPTFDQFKGGLGINYFGNRCQSTTRLTVNQNSVPVLDEKVTVSHGNLRFFENIAIALTTQQFLRYNSYIGFVNKDFDFYVNHESTKVGTPTLGRLSAAFIYRLKQATVAAQVSFENNAPSFTVGALIPIPKKSDILKLKLNDRAELSLVYKQRVHRTCDILVGSNVNLRDIERQFAATRKFLPIGITVDWNQTR